MPNKRSDKSPKTFCSSGDDGDFTPEHIVYLNIRPASGTPANGFLYVVEPTELTQFDEREWIYDRRIVTTQLEGVRVTGGDAYAYVGKPEWELDESRPRSWAGLRQSYLDVIETGLRDQTASDSFRLQYENSTDPIPTHRVFADQIRG